MNKIKKLERQIKKAKDKLSELEKEIALAYQEDIDKLQQVCFTSNHKIMSADGWVAPLQPSFSQDSLGHVVMMDERHYDSEPTDGFPKDDEHSLQQY